MCQCVCTVWLRARMAIPHFDRTNMLFLFWSLFISQVNLLRSLSSPSCTLHDIVEDLEVVRANSQTFLFPHPSPTITFFFFQTRAMFQCCVFHQLFIIIIILAQLLPLQLPAELDGSVLFMTFFTFVPYFTGIYCLHCFGSGWSCPSPFFGGERGCSM